MVSQEAEMALKFNCKECGEEIIVKWLKIGEKARCRNCGVENIVPTDAVCKNEEPSYKRPIVPESAKHATIMKGRTLIKCQECGSGVRDGAKFCGKCGAKITLISPELDARIDILKKKIEKDSLDPKLYAELGEIYLQNNLVKEALIEYQKAVSIDDSFFDAHLGSGDAYLELGELGKAESSYHKALNLNPKSSQAKSGLFMTYYLENMLEQAIQLGEDIIQTDANNLEVHKALKDIYLQKGMREKVFKELESISMLAPGDKESLKELAHFYAEKNEIEKELKCYEKVLELDPKDIETRSNIGGLLCEKGDYRKAIEYLKDIIEELPPDLGVYAHLYLAVSYIGQHQLDRSIEEINLVSLPDYEELGARDKKLFAEAYYKIGYAVFQNKSFSTAVEYLEKALKHEPQNAEYQKQLDAARFELAKLKSKSKKKRLVIAITMITVAIILVGGWYLSHGKIELQIAPAENVKVSIDRKHLEGVAILKPGVVRSPSLRFGVHRIMIEKEGYEKWEKDVKVAYNKTVRIQVTLVPIYGSLKINSKPSGTKVYLDEKLLGNTPLMASGILATKHILILKKEGYLSYEATVTILEKDVTNLDIRLTQLTSAEKKASGVIKEPAVYVPPSVSRKETKTQQEKGYEKESKEAVFSKVLKVPANRQWIDTGIMLLKGQRLIIKVSGDINHGCYDCDASPKGGRRTCGEYHCGAVIGKIGSLLKTFLVGESFERTIFVEGTLYLGVVDDRYEDNSGEFTATVSIK
jgi:tetratricopeptide (TPR) repeat protein/DNA-directed RNA polymerase subunit RPC12/RpoP